MKGEMMKATGIVRRIDDLGRVVIPKEIRRTMRIRESEPLEIFTGKEGEIILKKYSPISEMTDFAKQYAESLSQVSGRVALVADRDQFIAVSGGYRAAAGADISKELETKLEKRECFLAAKGERGFIPVSSTMPEEYIYEAVCPILSEGDMIGGVILLESDNKRKMNEGDLKLVQAAAGFLGKQMES
jgi:AbrB family transcriptional regulator (stage V sporulation protein T)